MPGFNYICVDQYGKQKKGDMEAVDESKVLQSLKNDGYIPVSVVKQNILNKPAEINFVSSIKPRDLSVLCRQLVGIVSSGVSVVSALYMLAEQTENKRLRTAIKDTQILVEKGETLSDAMRQHSKEFPAILINMVAAGETTGSIENSFERMASHFEKSSRTKALVKKAMVYPVVVMIVAIVVVIVMLVFVLPSFMTMFEDMGTKMPAMTMALIHLSEFIRDKWYLVLGIIAVVVGSFAGFKRSNTGKLILARLVLKVPVVGKFITKSASASFSRTLSTLISSGIPMVEAITITAKTLDNELFKQTVLAAREDVERGVPLSNQLTASKLFPPMVCHMTKIGEETGNIEEMLVKIADYYEEEVEIGAQTLTAAIEPLIIVFLALVVGVIIMSIMQPLFTMYESLDSI